MALAASLLPLVAGACGDDASPKGRCSIFTTTTRPPRRHHTTVLQVYEVQSGDRWARSERFGVTIAELMAAPLPDPDHIEVGATGHSAPAGHHHQHDQHHCCERAAPPPHR
jgi:hypothetical protein